MTVQWMNLPPEMQQLFGQQPRPPEPPPPPPKIFKRRDRDVIDAEIVQDDRTPDNKSSSDDTSPSGVT